MRKKQGSNPYPKHDITSLGDSQTDPRSNYGVHAIDTWTSKLSRMLNKRGCLTSPRIFGRGGDTTAHMLGRADAVFMYKKPSIGIIYGGVNDPFSNVTGTAQAGASNTITLAASTTGLVGSFIGNVISITSGTGSGQSKTIIDYNNSTRVATVDSNWSVNPNATSVYSIAVPTLAQMQANQQALIKMMKYGVKGIAVGTGTNVCVWKQSMLPANAKLGSRMVVMVDNSTTGGLLANSTEQNATIVADYSASPKQSVWERRNNQAGESGWGRVAIETTPIFADGIERIIVISTNYLNYTTGGDNYNTIASTGTQFSSYVNVRVAAKAATIAELSEDNYCDLYDFQSKLIYAASNGSTLFKGQSIRPEFAQGDFKYHYVDGNQHYSTEGHETVARAVLYTIMNLDWIDYLSN